MAGVFRKSVDFLRYYWAREPVVFVSCVLGISGPLFVLVSPWTKDTIETMNSIPRVYPYPQLEGEDLSEYDNHGSFKKVKYLF